MRARWRLMCCSAYRIWRSAIWMSSANAIVANGGVGQAVPLARPALEHDAAEPCASSLRPAMTCWCDAVSPLLAQRVGLN
ncbi:hypothetical protein A9K66_02385 [Mesorhizobium sp. AA23]|nr:hypothetical protein A9K66_02385 [Mesorhizobium sp. AA23]